MICANCGKAITLHSRYYRAGKNGTVFCSKDCIHEAYEGFYSKQEVDKTIECYVLESEENEEETESMENYKDEISNQASAIKANLETIDGQMMFLGELIEDTEKYPDASAEYMKRGLIQKKLNAIFILIDGQLKGISEYQECISNLVNDGVSDDK
ncbi:hypothetical protein [Virgibacillus sp.]|uniref:hypothetical protein n=1 Tax=Virgibacillus sp. TaxID=1872700 RepID=UPI0018366975|nr:hypothetical protein [Virgibacillus sp.]NWO14668.1 hypothetical protein [Virgibacillus sp.]